MRTNNIRLVIIVILTLSLFLGCNKDKLSDVSVIDNHWNTPPTTELDKWIKGKFGPYNIEVLYRWDKTNLPSGTIAYPPIPEKIPAVLEVLDALLFQTYSDARGGGAEFIRDKGIVRVILLGGYDTTHNNALLKLWNDRATTNEIYIYGVNDFDSKDSKKVYLLLRSLHHQFAKRLSVHIPYERDQFYEFSRGNYGSMALSPSDRELFNRIGLSSYAHRKGFYTLHSMTNPQDDFAEIVATLLLHSAVEIKEAEDKAAVPFDSSSSKSVKDAEEAHQALVAKREFVEQYFKKHIGLNIRRLQLISLKNIALYNQRQNNSEMQ